MPVCNNIPSTYFTSRTVDLLLLLSSSSSSSMWTCLTQRTASEHAVSASVSVDTLMPTGRFLLRTMSHQHVAVSLALAQQQQHTELLPLALPVAAQAGTREGRPARSLCLCCWAKSAGHADRAPGIRPAAPRAVPRGCLQSVLMGHSVAAPLRLCRRDPRCHRRCRGPLEPRQYPPQSGQPGKLHNTLHTAGFTAPSIQRASQHPPHSGQPGKPHNTLPTAGFTTPSSQRALQHPPHSGLYNTLRTAGFTTPSTQRALQHPPHSERSFTTPSAQREKLYNTLRTAGFTTPSAQREKLHNTLRTAGSKGNFTTPFTQWAAGKFHNTLHTGSGGWGGVGDYTTATTMTAGWRLRHCWIQHFST